MKVKEFYQPETIDQALEILHRTQAGVLAGGTDLIIALHERHIICDALLDLTGLAELKGIRLAGSTLRIGAMETFARIATNPLVLQHCPSLAEAASQVGAPQVRNRATVGGNVANAAAAGDSIPALLSLDARAVIARKTGARELSVGDVVIGLNRNCLAPDELITEFLIPLQKNRRMAFEKIGRRRALAISRINLAVSAALDQNRVEDIAVAVGAVGTTAYRVAEVEEFLIGKPLTQEVIQEAASLMDRIVAQNLKGRSTTPYKRKIAAAVLERALLRVAGEVLP